MAPGEIILRAIQMSVRTTEFQRVDLSASQLPMSAVTIGSYWSILSQPTGHHSFENIKV